MQKLQLNFKNRKEKLSMIHYCVQLSKGNYENVRLKITGATIQLIFSPLALVDALLHISLGYGLYAQPSFVPFFLKNLLDITVCGAYHATYSRLSSCRTTRTILSRS